jgi:hypothetical protein
MSKLGGMTLNERLVVTGLMPAWDAALLRRDREEMIELLGKVELSEQAAWIADSTLKRPSNSK